MDILPRSYSMKSTIWTGLLYSLSLIKAKLLEKLEVTNHHFAKSKDDLTLMSCENMIEEQYTAFHRG